jgi:hypothetical protein
LIKFIKQFALFSLVAILFYIVATIIWGMVFPFYFTKNIHYFKGQNNNLYTRLKEAKEYKDVDILFLGSSHTYRGFDNRIFEKYGYTTFNFGSSGQTPIQTEYLLNKYLKHLKPKLIVYDVYPNTLSSDGLESTLHILSDGEIDFPTFKLVLKTNHLKAYNTFFLAWFRQILSLDKDFVETLETNKDKYVSGGFVESKLETYTASYSKSKDVVFKPKQEKAFFNIINNIKKQNIPLLLVQIPVTKNYYNGIANKIEIDKYFENQSDYINFNNQIEMIDSLHFYDHRHLNQKGVEYFNHYLLNNKLLKKKINL